MTKWKDPIQEVLKLIRHDKPVRKRLLRLMDAMAREKESLARWRDRR